MTPEEEQRDLIERMAQTAVRNAAASGIDLHDPAMRAAYEGGVAFALGLLVSAKETGQLDPEAFVIVDDTLCWAAVSIREVPDHPLTEPVRLPTGVTPLRRAGVRRGR
jgi:hypothetical protein